MCLICLKLVVVLPYLSVTTTEAKTRECQQQFVNHDVLCNVRTNIILGNVPSFDLIVHPFSHVSELVMRETQAKIAAALGKSGKAGVPAAARGMNKKNVEYDGQMREEVACDVQDFTRMERSEGTLDVKVENVSTQIIRAPSRGKRRTYDWCRLAKTTSQFPHGKVDNRRHMKSTVMAKLVCEDSSPCIVFANTCFHLSSLLCHVRCHCTATLASNFLACPCSVGPALLERSDADNPVAEKRRKMERCAGKNNAR